MISAAPKGAPSVRRAHSALLLGAAGLWIAALALIISPLLLLGIALRTIGNWALGAAYWLRDRMEEIAEKLEDETT